MSETNPLISAEALAIRHEFDLAFTQEPLVQKAAPLNFLGIRLGDDVFAIRTSEIAGLYVDRRIMPMPSPVATLLGVVGFRGLIAPAYNLAGMLGYTGKIAPRWLVLVRLGEPIALAFENLELHFSANPEDIIKAPTTDGKKTLFYDAVRVENSIENSNGNPNGNVTRPIISLQSLLETIQPSHNQSLQQGSKTGSKSS
jgi:purine-binding chemotaxis protein CheW